MRSLLIAAALVGLSAAAAVAQDADMSPFAPPPPAKTWRQRAVDAAYAAKDAASSRLRAAASDAAIAGYRVALHLNAEQQKLWPAAAAALHSLAQAQQLDDAAVSRARAGIAPLIASLDDNQRQTAAALAQKAGLAQYASLF